MVASSRPWDLRREVSLLGVRASATELMPVRRVCVRQERVQPPVAPKKAIFGVEVEDISREVEALF